MTKIYNTQDYYNQNAKEYYDSRKDIIVKNQLDFFLKHTNPDELILDLGCGSGNNLFEMKKRGYSVIGADFSKKLIDIIYDKHNEKIYYLDFRDIEVVNQFIAEHKVKHLFCSASLLHLSKTDFKGFLQNLKLTGLFFFSLKEGAGEEIDAHKRLFSYYQLYEIKEIIKNDYIIIDFQVLDDSMGRDKRWMNLIILKDQ